MADLFVEGSIKKEKNGQEFSFRLNAIEEPPIFSFPETLSTTSWLQNISLLPAV